MRFSKARKQPLPVADEFEVEEFHGSTCADEELAVVLNLDKWDALLAQAVLLLSGEEVGCRLGEISDEPV